MIYVFSNIVCRVPIDDILQSRPKEINENGAAVNVPLHQIVLSGRLCKRQCQFLRQISWNAGLDDWDNVCLVVASGRKRAASRVCWVPGIGSIVVEDAPNVGVVRIWAVARTASRANAEPVVLNGLVGIDDDVVPLT